MMLLGGWRGTGSVPYWRECPPIGRWLEGAGHFWKVSVGGSTPPVGTEIMSFFGGRGGDSFIDMHGSFTGAPSAVRERGGGVRGVTGRRSGSQREGRTCEVIR